MRGSDWALRGSIRPRSSGQGLTFLLCSLSKCQTGRADYDASNNENCGLAVCLLGLALLSNLAAASEYCTKEQYERDRALIENAISIGMLIKGPKSLRDSILVKEDEWFKMDYPQQIVFMQSFECAMAGFGGKHLLYMDVRSLATGRLLATWSFGALNPCPERFLLVRRIRSAIS